MIYLDNAATTRMHPEVISVMEKSFHDDFANTGTVYSIGHDAKRKLRQIEGDIAQLLQLPKSFKLVFTSGGTESNNLFIKGLGLKDPFVACLGLEHPSITQTLSSFENCVSLLEYQKGGCLPSEAVSHLADRRVRLLCLSHINNELGSINDIPAISRELKLCSPQTRLFVDGVQAVGKWNYTPDFWDGISGYSLSAHKFQGPKGIGLLAYDSRVQINPQMQGGSQQDGVRAGTLPLPLIVGLKTALELSIKKTKSSLGHFKMLYESLVSDLRSLERERDELTIKLNSRDQADTNSQSPAICNFSFPPVEGEVVLHHLEAKNICVGLGSACSAHSKEPSKILLGIGCSKQEALCSLRVSFGIDNTQQDVDVFVREFGNAWSSLFPAFSNRVVSK